jgi:hypothetical protein
MVKHALLLIALVGCGAATGSNPADAPDVTVTAMVVTPSTKAMVHGLDEPVQLSAMATLSSSKTRDVTFLATWSTSDPMIAAVDATGRVTPTGMGTAMITASFGGMSASASLTIKNPTMYVVENGSRQILAFDAYASGNVAPSQVIAGAATGFNFIWGIAVTDTDIYVADSNGAAVDVFPINTAGNVAPSRHLFGANTKLQSSFAVAIYNNEMYVTSAGTILVFPVTADGNLAPSRTILGPTTMLGATLTSLAIDHDEIFVANAIGSNIQVFPVNAAGDTAPIRTIAGPHTRLVGSVFDVFVWHNELYASTSSGVLVFDRNATGDVAPVRELIGPAVGSNIVGARPLGTELYMATISPASISVAFPGSTGDAAPLRSLAGAMTTISAPRQIAFH